MVRQWQRAGESEQEPLKQPCLEFARRIIAHWPEGKFASGYYADYGFEEYKDEDLDEEDSGEEVHDNEEGDDQSGFEEDGGPQERAAQSIFEHSEYEAFRASSPFAT